MDPTQKKRKRPPASDGLYGEAPGITCAIGAWLLNASNNSWIFSMGFERHRGVSPMRSGTQKATVNSDSFRLIELMRDLSLSH